MSTQEELYAAILHDPLDDAPRLIYADWMEDNGDEARAAFVRVQVEEAKVAAEKCFCGDHPDPTGCWRCRAVAKLRRRVRELETYENVDAWLKPGLSGLLGMEFDMDSWGFLVGGREVKVVFRRGFVAEVQLPIAVFLGGGECGQCDGMGWVDGQPKCPPCGNTGIAIGVAADLFKSHPITTVVLTDRWPYHLEHIDLWRWFLEEPPGAPTSEFTQAGLPPDLFDKVYPTWPPTTFSKIHGLHFDTRKDAIRTLSDAAVAYGRQLVGLGPVISRP